MRVLKFGVILCRNLAATIVDCAFDQGITRIIIVLGFDINDEFDAIFGRRERIEPDIERDSAFGIGSVFVVHAVDFAVSLIFELIRRFCMDTYGADLGFTFDTFVFDVADFTVFELGNTAF